MIRRRWKWVGFYLLWLVLLIAVSFWQTGLENQQLFLSKMKVLACGVPGPYNYSLPGIIQNVYYGNILAYEQMPAQAPAWLCFSGKALAVVLLAGALLILIRRNRGGDVAWDLIVLALVTLLIAPFTWRHYYTLEILPLIFVWFSLRRGRFSNLNAVRWTAIICTFVAATRYPDYLQVHLTNGPARVFLVSLLALSALALTIVLLFAYRDEVPPEKVGLMA